MNSQLPPPTVELKRQAVHFAAGLPVFLLPVLTREQAISMAAVALLLNAFVLPRLPWTRSLFRPGEGRVGGIVFYPVVVLLVLALFPYPLVGGCSWAILASGDAVASVVGTRFPLRPWRHNQKKSWGGSIAFVLFASLWTLGVGVYLSGDLDAKRAGVIVGAVLIAAIVETLPLPLDDNLTVGISSALVLEAGFRWVS